MRLLARALAFCVSATLGFSALTMGAVLLAGATAQGQEQARLMPQLGIGTIVSVAFSPDGRLVLTGSEDATARLWDEATGLQIRAFTGHTGDVTSVAFSPKDGRFVLTGSGDGTARLWDAATGQQIRSFVAHPEGFHYTADGSMVDPALTSVAFSPDGRFVLTGSHDNTARLWDATTGQQIRSFEGHRYSVTSVTFSSDGRFVLTGSLDDMALLWDAATGTQIRSFKWPSDMVKAVAISPDGRYVLTCGFKTARLWDAATGKLIRSFAGGEDVISVDSAAFSADGRSVLTASDVLTDRGEKSTAQLWDIVTGQQIRVFAGHTSTIESVAFSPDGRFVLTGSLDRTARLWNAASGEQIRSFTGHTGGVWSVAFSPDGRYLLTGSTGALARLWDTATGQQAGSFEGEKRFEAETRMASIVAFSPDGRIVLTGNAGSTVSLWNAATGKLVQSFDDPMGAVYSAVFSPDGRFVLTGSSNWKAQAQLWDAATGQPIRSFPDHSENRSMFGHTADVCPVAFSPDGRFVLTGSEGSTASQWDAATGQPIRSFEGHKGKVYAVAFSPDGRFVLTGSEDHTARLWDVQSGKELLRFEEPSGSVVHVAFSPDSRKVLTVNDSDVARMWDAATGNGLYSFKGHTAAISSAAFSLDGRFVLTGSADTTTRLWDAASGKQLATLISFENGGWAVTDADGRFDTSNLDGGAPLVWVASSDPMRPLPLEVFMRDYYTPRLLSRIINGETLPPVRPISEIKNRVQPDVSIASVTASKAHSGRADVVVYAASHTNEKGQASGLEDLRLFRNGQLVGYRAGSLKDGDYTFNDIQLPTSMKSVMFTAYAFNSMNIKSATAQKDYAYEPGAPAKAHAYLLQIGVNHYQASGCELHGSATDAEELSKVLTERLTARGLKVKPVRLVSTLTENGATKEKIRNALQAIAAVATPDDVFFLSFSGHGYGDKNGQFYILPSDVQGSCQGVDDAMLKQAISADELAEWLRPIDAGEMTFILDSCQSASSMEANDFKPGPMGSRGLGQLAYDKRMRILAASQSNQEAQERNLPVGNGEGAGQTQGLLSYALTEEGLVEGKADWKPIDQKITVGEWLSYAADAVPKSLETGAVKTPRGVELIGEPTPHAKSAQIPAVFDFSKKDTFVLQ